jgi:hypothetical protein
MFGNARLTKVSGEVKYPGMLFAGTRRQDDRTTDLYFFDKTARYASGENLNVCRRAASSYFIRGL